MSGTRKQRVTELSVPGAAPGQVVGDSKVPGPCQLLGDAIIWVFFWK